MKIKKDNPISGATIKIFYNKYFTNMLLKFILHHHHHHLLIIIIIIIILTYFQFINLILFLIVIMLPIY